jgi:zinc resistance-associated protein
MWKTVLAGAAAVAILGSSAVYAQDRAAPASGARDVAARWQPTAEDFSAFTDARVAALKVGLKLTPEQEKNWPAFEHAYRDLSKARADQMRAFREQRRSNQAGTDYLSRLQRRADALIARGNALKSFAAAAAPLYQSLDEAQKHRFAALSRATGPRHHHRFAAWHRGASEQR